MRVYVLTLGDLDTLLAAIDRDPKHGRDGGSSQTFTPEEKKAFESAHRFYNYQVRTWIEKVTKDKQ